MNAQEARKRSELNQINLEECLKQIEKSTETGGIQIQLFSVKAEVIPELMKLGFKIHIHKDPYNGIENHICSW